MVYRQKATQLSLESFGSALGTPLSPDNEWVQYAELIPWAKLEEAYQLQFPSKTGRAAKPFRLLYGATLIQLKKGLTDRQVVDDIRDTPAYQYFIGLPEYRAKKPFEHTTLVHFRQRLSAISDLIRNITNDFTRERLEADLPEGTHVLISDATAVPVKIKYPQDTTLLNQSRLNIEQMVTDLAHGLGVEIPRTYRREAKGKWTAFSRKPRRQNKERRKQLQAQLQYIRRDLRYVAELLAQGGQLTDWQAQRLEVIKQVYEQQLFMFENHTHHVENRIVSLQQPYIRPIVRGKAKQSVEFGAKIDCSMLDGVIDVERFDFNSFNESTDLEVTLDHAFDLVGEYPDEVLVDTLYRTRDNINLCKKLGIKLNGPKLGRKPKHVDPKQRKADVSAENRRGAIERKFAFLKGSLGLDLVNTRTAESLVVTVDSAIALANIDLLLKLFSVPISIVVEQGGLHYQINYKVTEIRPETAA